MEESTELQPGEGEEGVSDVLAESKSLDAATLDPEAFIEHEMEYPEAEAIEKALVETLQPTPKMVSSDSPPHEVSDSGDSDSSIPTPSPSLSDGNEGDFTPLQQKLGRPAGYLYRESGELILYKYKDELSVMGTENQVKIYGDGSVPEGDFTPGADALVEGGGDHEVQQGSEGNAETSSKMEAPTDAVMEDLSIVAGLEARVSDNPDLKESSSSTDNDESDDEGEDIPGGSVVSDAKSGIDDLKDAAGG